MKYLLDVNALIAWSQQRAPHHGRFHDWAATVGTEEMVSCAHVELGFIRVSMQAFGDTLPEAQAQLTAMKRSLGGFVSEAPAPRLPAWAKTAARSSDGYLVQLAGSAGLTLATFDASIPGALLIR